MKELSKITKIYLLLSIFAIILPFLEVVFAILASQLAPSFFDLPFFDNYGGAIFFLVFNSLPLFFTILGFFLLRRSRNLSRDRKVIKISLILSVAAALIVLFFILVASGQPPILFQDLRNLEKREPFLFKAYSLIKISEAWDLINNKANNLGTTTIGIIDTGIDASDGRHPEFQNVAVDALSPQLFMDSKSEGHGTQVTGIIGANNTSFPNPDNYIFPQMNGILSGVHNFNYRMILGKKPLTAITLYTLASTVEGLRKRGATVINMSFANPIPAFSLSGFFVFKRIFEKSLDTLFIVPAGQLSVFGFDFPAVDAELISPANFGDNFNNVITVGATNITPSLEDQRVSGSNFGSAVGIAAPGLVVYGPAPRGKGNFPTDVIQEKRDYDQQFGGTSASAPMVTGVAGLIKAIKPELTPAQIKQIIAESGDLLITPDVAERSKTLGAACGVNRFLSGFRGCRLNAFNAACHQSVLGEKCLPDFTLYDDFSTPKIDFSRWMFSEFVRDIRNGKFVSKVRTGGNFSIFNSLLLRSPAGVTSIEARILSEKLDVLSSGGSAQARLFQKIYNDGSSPTPGIGDVVAQISVLRSFGSSPIVRLALFRCLDASCVNVTVLFNTAFPGVTPVLGEEINLGISWDGAEVTFKAGDNTQVINPSSMASVASPVPTLPLVFIGTTAFRTDSFASASFDEVKINGAPFDDFSQPEINTAKWLQQEFVREIQDGKLILKTRAVNTVLTSSLPFRNPQNINGVRADVAVLDIGAGFPDNQVARLIGTFYKTAGSEGGVGRDGDIIAAMRIIGNEASGLKASFTMFKCFGATCSQAPHIFTDTFAEVALGAPHNLLLFWDGTRFFYGFDQTLKIVDPQTFAPVVSSSPGSKLLDVQSFSFGKIEANFDNIKIVE